MFLHPKVCAEKHKAAHLSGAAGSRAGKQQDLLADWMDFDWFENCGGPCVHETLVLVEVS